MLVLGIVPHVLGQHVDPLGEDGHLDLGRAGVPLVGAVGINDRSLLFFTQHGKFPPFFIYTRRTAPRDR